MAAMNTLNKINRAQGFLLSLRWRSQLQSVTTVNAIAAAFMYQHRCPYRTWLTSRHDQRFYGVDSSAAIETPPSTTVSIDEFRAREEEREKEFARQQAAEEKDQSQHEYEAKRSKIKAIRRKILAASLPHVPTLGWTRNAIVQGAEDVGMPGIVHGMFPEGGFALVSYFNGQCNEELVKLMQKNVESDKENQSNAQDFMIGAMRSRLEMILPYKSQWPQALALVALPQNASTALAQVLTLVDDICYFSGDRSVDFGWYTRRVGLAIIMKMTEIFMLQDSSLNHAKTWAFLENRMEEAVQMDSFLSKSDDVRSNLQRSFKSAFITARNILGIDYNR